MPRLGRVVSAIEEAGGHLLITADHGNVEQMLDPETHQPLTSHTNGPVPLVYVGASDLTFTGEGSLCDIAPTLLYLMSMPVPDEMTGKVPLQPSELPWRAPECQLSQSKPLARSGCRASACGFALVPQPAAQEREQVERDLSEVTAAIVDIQVCYKKPRLAKPNRKARLEKLSWRCQKHSRLWKNRLRHSAAARAEQQSLQQQSRELLASMREQEQIFGRSAPTRLPQPQKQCAQKHAQRRKSARGCAATALHALSVGISAYPDHDLQHYLSRTGCSGCRGRGKPESTGQTAAGSRAA